MSKLVTIRVSREVRDALHKLKAVGMTYSTVINDLLLSRWGEEQEEHAEEEEGRYDGPSDSELLREAMESEAELEMAAREEEAYREEAERNGEEEEG